MDATERADKIEVLTGMLLALDNEAAVSEIVERAADRDEAARLLVESPIGFTVVQAQFGLIAHVSPLTEADRDRLAEELASLDAEGGT